jgi:hypothetical protein
MFICNDGGLINIAHNTGSNKNACVCFSFPFLPALFGWEMLGDHIGLYNSLRHPC